MQLLQPEIQKYVKNIKDVQMLLHERMQRETMELYKKHGTNPMSSCMPVLLQLPVFIALYSVLNATTELAKGLYYGSKTLADELYNMQTK